MSSVSREARDGIDTQYLYTTSLHVSYRIQNERCIIILSSALFQTEAWFFVARKSNGIVSSFSRFRNQDLAWNTTWDKNDYAECYLLSLKNTPKAWNGGRGVHGVMVNVVWLSRFKNDSPSQSQEFSIVENQCKREVACLLSDCQDSFLVHGVIIYACFSGCCRI